MKFNKKTNPEPSNFTHHSTLEITWTLVPTAILVVIGAFSLPMLFKQLNIPEYDLTIKATGNQWYWSYEYPDQEISFDSFMLTKEELSQHGYSDDEYLLATDNPVIVPISPISSPTPISAMLVWLVSSLIKTENEPVIVI